MPGDGHGDHHEGLKSIREEHYKGKHIRIETHYTITIDGEPVNIHMEVMNNGRVHCHTLPQYSTPSAVGIIKAMIDAEADVAQPDDELNDTSDESGNQNCGGNREHTSHEDSATDTEHTAHDEHNAHNHHHGG